MDDGRIVHSGGRWPNWRGTGAAAEAARPLTGHPSIGTRPTTIPRPASGSPAAQGAAGCAAAAAAADAGPADAAAGGQLPDLGDADRRGLAMGMMIFIMASGLTLIFGLMDVLNFGHGAFVSVGAFTATLVLLPMKGWMQADSVLMNLSVLGLAIAAGHARHRRARLGLRTHHHPPVYGQHLKQILITMGGMIVAEQMIHVIWGPSRFRCNCRRPSAASSSSATPPREIPADRRRRRADGLRRRCSSCSTAPRSAC
jgi:hypothetical protein